MSSDQAVICAVSIPTLLKDKVTGQDQFLQNVLHFRSKAERVRKDGWPLSVGRSMNGLTAQVKDCPKGLDRVFGTSILFSGRNYTNAVKGICGAVETPLSYFLSYAIGACDLQRL